LAWMLVCYMPIKYISCHVTHRFWVNLDGAFQDIKEFISKRALLNYGLFGLVPL
jgi:hypothetical protein